MDAASTASLWLGVVLYENSREEISRLCTSLQLNREQGAPAFQLHWLDNSPSREREAWVLAFDPESHYQSADANLGYGVGHNLLMQQAFAVPGVRAYVSLNPDAFLHPRCLTALVQEAERLPAAGLVEARLFPDEHPKAYGPITHDTAWCSGTVLLVSRGLYQSIGGFDSRFFMYCEDVDLSWRARAAGFPVRIAPGARAHHYTLDRPLSPTRERQVRKSGALLAAKYGNARFMKQCLAEYLALGGEPFSLSLERPSSALSKAATFDGTFDFGPMRW